MSTHNLINLTEWLQIPESISKHNFQSLESFLKKQQENQIFRFASAPRSRSATTESDLVSVTGVQEIQLSQHSLVLSVNYQQEINQSRSIILRLYPNGDNTYLPPDVKLIVLDNGEFFLEAQARDSDNWIQLEFSGETGERFTIKVTLGDCSLTQKFII